MLQRLTWLLIFASAWAATRGRAQVRPLDATRELGWQETAGYHLDPLDLDDSTGRALDEAATRFTAVRKQATSLAPSVPESGNVLSAATGVMEVEHVQRVTLDQGLAFVDVVMRFESRSTFPAEVAYRLPLPRDAVVTRVAACKHSRCAPGRPEREAPPRAEAQVSDAPEVLAWPIEDRAGTALSIRAASVEKGAPLELRVAYVAPAALHAGVARFCLPARGYDARIAPSNVEPKAGRDLVLESPASIEALEPAMSVEIRASLDPAAGNATTTTSRARCAGTPCTRSFVAARALPPKPRETWLLLDASPSMEGNPRNRADLVLPALLASMPAESPLRAFAFAARAHEIGRYEAQLAPLKPLSDALLSDLGGASLPARALAKGVLSGGRPLVLIVSDGKLDARAVKELLEARTRGAELWLLDVGDEASRLRGFDGIVDVRGALSEGLTNTKMERLEEVLRLPFGPTVGAGLRAGEQRVREQGPRRPYLPGVDDGWLSFWLARGAPLYFRSAKRTSQAYLAARPFEQAPPAPPAVETGMPKESVLSMLRSQLIPQARACLRSDRKGRLNYAVAVTFHALFADRETYDVRVEGNIDEALRGCLTDVIARLRVPAFTGRIRVRYPIYTERAEEPPTIELEPSASEQVDRVIRGK